MKAVVLGAGLLGRLMAWRLARAGWRVEVYEAQGPDAQGAAARVAAAMLAPLAESAITEPPVVRMGQHALARWPQWLAELSRPVFFQREGTLVLWHRQDAGEATRLKRVWQQHTDTIEGLPAAQTLDAAGIAALEPSLGQRFTQGLLLPDEGQLDNRALLDALRLELDDLGVTIHWNHPAEPDAQHADWVLDCRGLGARTAWSGLRGVRGEVLRLHAPEVSLSRPTRLLHPRYPLYIAPKPGHLFVVGATEIEAEDFSPASVRSTLELLSAAYSVHSGFAEARILEIATQCRPALPDNLPAIRADGPGRLSINGLYRHGFLVAPAVVDAALALIERDDPAPARQWQLLT